MSGWVAARQKRIAAGLCCNCGKEPLEAGHASLGPVCARDQRNKSRDFQRMLRASRVCTSCGKAPATIAGKCAPCYPKFIQCKKESVARRMARGECEKCVRKRPADSARWCEVHREKKRQMVKARAARKRREMEASP